VPADLLALVALGTAAVAAAVAVLALVVAGRAVARARRLERRRPVSALPAGDLGVQVAQLRADLGTALRHVAVVRYDAFGDLAGRLSFSAALLDDAGDGVVLTSINGRSDTRTYAKGVTAGTSPHPLSPEEQEAVARARCPQPALRAG
jgi:hypothetical protein